MSYFQCFQCFFIHLIAILASILIFSANINGQSSFQLEVEECYNQKKFNDIIYRMKHDKECYIGKTFPPVSLEDLNGDTITNADFVNKILVLNFWFLYCPPCLEEIPILNEIYNDYQNKDVLFLAPSTDDAASLLEYKKKEGAFLFNIIPNASAFMKDELGSKSGFPTTMVVDKDGIIMAYFGGGFKMHEELSEIIDALLEED